ncbi:alpha/beta hydrolase [Rhizobium binae]|uniref:alpha/beta fold hydrolase n=1 Tax=Rhizobium binae TaxID=1138190 RepID=UPI001C83EF19|nr:alpha/beta hydrolase [Rhizobium binae]MBX4951117.1 alpha/beta hydrolase [Rhizobium binae]
MKQPCAKVPRVGEILQVDHHKIHMLRRSRANRPEVVFLHGCGSLAEEVVVPFEGRANIGIIAPDRPGYGFSSPLPSGSQGPLGQSVWLEAFLEHIGGGPRMLVAHSIGCAAPLLLARRRPDLIRAMLLIAPCCRPVPFKPLLLLRTAMTPLIGSAIRRQMTTRWPEMIFDSAVRTSAGPNPVPEYLAALPARHIVSSPSIETMAAELSAFNADMAALGHISSDLPITVVFGDRDRVIDHRWHSEWIRRNHDQALLKTLRGVGHLPHHVCAEVCVELLERLVEANMSPMDNRRSLVA